MPVSVGLDADGNATPALLKRLAALGADASAVAGLQRAPDGKAEALFFQSTVKGATLAEGLQKALAEAIAKLPVPKLMSYQLSHIDNELNYSRSQGTSRARAYLGDDIREGMTLLDEINRVSHKFRQSSLMARIASSLAGMM